jgi:Flp pilus assembly protein TadD
MEPFTNKNLSEAVALHRSGRLPQAEARYRSVLADQPEDPDALSLLGVCLFQQGRVEEAWTLVRKAARLRPDSADIQQNAGSVASAIRHYAEAAEYLSRFRELGGVDDDVDNNLGIALKELGRLDEAEQILEALLGRSRGHARAWNTLAAVYLEAGRDAEAERCIDKALALDPDSETARGNRVRLNRRRVPMWHFAMMNDLPRNEAFERAIAAVVSPGSLVLDIGTGSGLLAMMAARAGADHVVGCEMAPAVAGAAKRIIRANGLEEKISVICRKSVDLAPSDLTRPADLLIAEVFDAGFFGEEALDTIEDARRRLLAPGAAMIPAGARLWGAPVESPELAGLARVEEVAGFDLSGFNEFSPESFQHALASVGHRFLAEPECLFELDFAAGVPVSDEAEVTMTPTSGGRAHAFVCWFELLLGGGVVFSTSPRGRGTHWDQKIHLLASPPDLQPGRPWRIRVHHNRRRLSVTGIGL